MRSIILGTMKNRLVGFATGLGLAALTAACAGAPELSPAALPLSKDTMMHLAKKGMTPEAPIFVRIFKEESEFEIWKQRDDGRFYHFKTYPICNWSGDVGPKIKQGDRQAPEGFYTIFKGQMNPNSAFHLAFNVGFPNAYDKVNGRTGSALMVHGKCKSAGCYAMTDALIEEIYALAREQFTGGNESFQVHAYPFRMTQANLERHKGSPWEGFWKTLKDGSDYFEATRIPPPVLVCGRQYRVNAVPRLRTIASQIDPAAPCPPLENPAVEPFVPRVDQQIAAAPLVAPGLKRRSLAANSSPTGESPPAGGLSGWHQGGTNGQALGVGFAGSNK